MKISHVMFAYDLFMMFVATKTFAKLITIVSEEFAELSSLKPIMEKSEVFYAGMREQAKIDFCNRMRMKKGMLSKISWHSSFQ